jgi:Cu+-exporting ATPase
MFDKTGTLTQGRPKVSHVYSVSGKIQPEKWLMLAATLENLSEHPLAKAIAAAGEINPNETVNEFRNDRGHGVSGIITGRLVRVGSVKWLAGQGVALSEEASRKIEDWSANAYSIAGVAIDHEMAGLLAIEDAVRPDAKAAIERLLRMELNVGVISGDRQAAVRSLATRLHIPLDDIYAETTPEDKSNVLQRMRQSGSRVAMVGDGLNDAPALASADVSMAMASGTDVAKNAADIVIVGSELASVAEAIALSRATLTTIRHNLFWAFAYNVVAIPLAAVGVFQSNGPLIASVAMAGSSITVVLRSAWLGRMK